MKQQTQSEMEYSCRKKKTKREEFLEIMGEEGEPVAVWDEVSCGSGRRDRLCPHDGSDLG